MSSERGFVPPRRWLVTGGLGFIGSHFIRIALAERPELEIVNLDALTYAGNLMNLRDVECSSRYRFVRGDISDPAAVEAAMAPGVSAVVNFAAESHVDRSLIDAEPFKKTNVMGVRVLLDAAVRHRVARFLQVSTDEVYGDVVSGEFSEESPPSPSNPYSASKAEGEALVLEYRRDRGVPMVITRGSNTYGPYQYPEKLIPLFITNLIDDEPVPLYGDGMQIRDWLHAEDHARGILHVLDAGVSGNVYNLAGGNSCTNLEIAHRLLAACGRSPLTHLRHVTDRPNHDRRYAMSGNKAHALGWRPRIPFEAGLSETVEWYKSNEDWWRRIKRGEFAAYCERQYSARSEERA
ncbi:MAG TPA: dTDP-glucose 4,6-dehydratase [Candidatus Baltobacteraceae bacterium]|nr:dTDP-glucose 4,6-dehydratase [Candidatus Baltobacteraceae bacterium]